MLRYSVLKYIFREILVNIFGYKLRIRSLLKRNIINNLGGDYEKNIYDKGRKHIDNIYQHLKDNNIKVNRKDTFLEMGPGGSVLHGLMQICDGWKTYIGIDAFPSQVWSKYPSKLYKKYIDSIDSMDKSKIENIIKSSKSGSGPIFYFGNDGLDNIVFKEKYSDKSIDFIYSWGVLEHIDNPKEQLRKNYNLLADNGYILHVIDPHPHTWNRFEEKFIFLTIPNFLWKLMYYKRGFINRVRASSYEKWAKEVGFTIISNKKEISEHDISKYKHKIKKNIDYIDDDDIKTDRLYLLLKK